MLLHQHTQKLLFSLYIHTSNPSLCLPAPFEKLSHYIQIDMGMIKPRSKLPLSLITIAICAFAFFALFYAERFSTLSPNSVLKFKSCSKKGPIAKSTNDPTTGMLAVNTFFFILLVTIIDINQYPYTLTVLDQ